MRAGNSTAWRNESQRSRSRNMLSQAQRTAILELSAKGVSKHEIAHVLRLSRLTVRKVLGSNSTNVPEIQRAEKAEPYREQILDLLTSCKGNLVRVHEELVAGGAALSYPALTGFCRASGKCRSCRRASITSSRAWRCSTIRLRTQIGRASCRERV